MSPSKLNATDELNYLIKLHDISYFQKFIEFGKVSYRVAMFKAIEYGSLELVEIIRWYHPHPEDEDIELECLHSAFRGQLTIYQTIRFDEELEELNMFKDNMFLYHGKLNKVRLDEITIQDLLLPKVIPVNICDIILSKPTCQRSSIVTGILLIYCIHNSNHYIYLKDDLNIFIMNDMFKYAIQYGNKDMVEFLLDYYKNTRQYVDYNYKIRQISFNKQKKYNGDLKRFDQYIEILRRTPTFDLYENNNILSNETSRRTPTFDLYENNIILSNETSRRTPTFDLHEKNIILSNEMFVWQYKNTNQETDKYFEKVLNCINRFIDEGVELKEEFNTK